MPDTGIIGLIIAGAAAAVLVIYRLEVLRDVFKGDRSRWNVSSTDVRSAAKAGHARDLLADEIRIGRTVHRRMSPLLFEAKQSIAASAGTLTVLAVNLGGSATGIAANSDLCDVHVNPPTIEPDDEVQFTFSNLGEESTSPVIPFTLSYVNASGQPVELPLRLNAETRELS
ncbi:MAG: hypothetical protein KDD65_11865 [Bacteroidetes bacterium]|nr:hypothetical protein [Bacteroidota bacterium]